LDTECGAPQTVDHAVTRRHLLANQMVLDISKTLPTAGSHLHARRHCSTAARLRRPAAHAATHLAPPKNGQCRAALSNSRAKVQCSHWTRSELSGQTLPAHFGQRQRRQPGSVVPPRAMDMQKRELIIGRVPFDIPSKFLSARIHMDAATSAACSFLFQRTC